MDWQQHLNISVKAALASALSWLAVQPLPGVADDYPYYAPLGAVIAVTSTVAGSIRESLQGLAAILTGAALALIVMQTDLPVVADLAVVVGIGTVVSGWQRYGAKASWVPITGLFVLIIGRGDAVDYAIAYLGLTSLGAAIGIALNIAFPPLALQPMSTSVTRLRGELADQLDELAEGLSQETPLTAEEWEAHKREIRPTLEEMQRIVGHATDGRRANWRARRWSDHAEQRYQQARALQQVAFLIEDIAALVVDQERAELEVVALGPELRPHAAQALRCLGQALCSVEADTADPDRLRAADRAVAGLAEAIRDARQRSRDDMFAAGTVVSGARRAIASLTPAELRDQLPSDW
ncbi:MAG: FUSC family protein [Nocardioides sp.]